MYTDETIDTSNIRPLFLGVMQAQSPQVMDEEAKRGDLFVEGIGVVKQPLIGVVWKRAFHRIFRTSANVQPSETFCSSPDGKVGYGDPGGECKSCEFAQWQGPKVPPQCTEVYSYLLHLPEVGVIASVDLQKTGVQAAKVIDNLSLINPYGKLAVAFKTREASGPQNSRYFKMVVEKAELPAEYGFTLSSP